MENKKMEPALRFPGFTDPWEQRKLGDILDYEQPNSYIVHGTEYDNTFKTPVLTAGQSFILGYTNETHGIKNASKNSPVIIFDDFTTSSHLVSFPFKIKSSAMKLLTLHKKEDDIDCVYNVLGSLSFVPSGHNRHWISIFSNIYVLMPSDTDEQREIGSLMRSFDNLITLHQRKLSDLQKLKAGLLQKMFPKNGSDVPEVRFPGFTDAWEQRKVSDLFLITRGNVLASSKISASKTVESPYPVFSSQTKDEGLMGFYNRYLYEDSITWTTDGANAGTVSFRTGKFYCTNVCGVLLSQKIEASEMISEALNRVSKKYVSYVGNPKLMNNTMANIRIWISSSKVERKEISIFFRQIDNLITLHQRKLENLQKLKKSLLQQMFI